MKTMQHKFVEFIPQQLEQGVLYVSFEYRTAVHLCVCGCGNKVVTPLSPTDWEITFDGKTVSLSPSIGNWNFKCRSHYFITKNKIRMMRKWDEDEIKENRDYDEERKFKYFRNRKT